jgi:hypothetical protein
MQQQRETQSNTPLAEAQALSATEIARREAENGLRQYDVAAKIIEDSIAAGEVYTLRPQVICHLNLVAIDGVDPCPGIYRVGPISITNTAHVPPGGALVPVYVQEMCDYVNANAGVSAIHQAAFLLWRLNWIHPFCNGNGRTSRMISYVMLCVRLGVLLPGKVTLPEQIANEKSNPDGSLYYAGLEAADIAWKRGVVDVSSLESMLSDQLVKQLQSA